MGREEERKFAQADANTVGVYYSMHGSVEVWKCVWKGVGVTGERCFREGKGMERQMGRGV